MILRVTVQGKVQGVYFRESTRQEAERLGVDGWVRNLPDGRVEGLFSGSADAVSALVDWCGHGPSAARVDGLEAEPDTERPPAGFRVLR